MNAIRVKTEAEIRALLEHIERDDRLGYRPALVQVNAPLALIQTELDARAETLRWVLGHRDHGGGSAGSPEKGGPR